VDILFDNSLWVSMIEPVTICSALSIVASLGDRKGLKNNMVWFLLSNTVSSVCMGVSIHIIAYRFDTTLFNEYEYVMLIVAGLGGEPLLRNIQSFLRNINVVDLLRWLRK